MENLYYIAHAAPDALEKRGFGWPEAPKGKKGKGKGKGKKKKKWNVINFVEEFDFTYRWLDKCATNIFWKKWTIFI